MSSHEAPVTIMCVWCNRVLVWGQADLSYDVCTHCLPSAVAAIQEQRTRRARDTRPFAALLRAVR